MADYLFNHDANAGNWAGVISSDRTGTISVVGVLTTEVVEVEVQTVTSPDKDNDANWTPLMQKDEAVTLRSGHNAERIIGNLLVRIKKPAGVAGNAYTVRFA